MFVRMLVNVEQHQGLNAAMQISHDVTPVSASCLIPEAL